MKRNRSRWMRWRSVRPCIKTKPNQARIISQERKFGVKKTRIIFMDGISSVPSSQSHHAAHRSTLLCLPQAAVLTCSIAPPIYIIKNNKSKPEKSFPREIMCRCYNITWEPLGGFLSCSTTASFYRFHDMQNPRISCSARWTERGTVC